MEIADRDHVIASHARLEGKQGLQIDIRHYLPVLERKPRAITGMASFRTLPAIFIRVRDHLVSSLRREGWKEMVAILLLLQDYPMKSVETAMEKAEAAGSVRADTVCSVSRKWTGRLWMMDGDSPSWWTAILSMMDTPRFLRGRFPVKGS